MSTTAPISATQSAGAPVGEISRLPSKTLGQEDFLKLLVAKLTSQDPLKPQEDTEFISQMAQFSSLEQSRSTQTDMAQLRANSLLGRKVELQAGSGSTVSGVVSGIRNESGTPKLIVDGQAYDLNQVISVAMNTNNQVKPFNLF